MRNPAVFLETAGLSALPTPTGLFLPSQQPQSESPKLPALRADVSAKVRARHLGFLLLFRRSVQNPSIFPIPAFLAFAEGDFSCCRARSVPTFFQRSRTEAQRPVFWCLAGTRSAGLRKPHKPPTRARRRGGGVLSGFVLRSRISLHGDFQQLLCDLFVGETDQVIVGSFIGQQVHAAVPDEAAV